VGAHGHTLLDQAGNGVGVVGAADEQAAALVGQLDDGLGHGGLHAHHHTGGPHLDGAQLSLVAVGHQHDVAGFHGVLQHVRAGGADYDLAALEVAGVIAGQHGAAQNLHHVLNGGAGVAQSVGIQAVHVGNSQIAQGDQALQHALFVHHGLAVGLGVAHGFPCAAHGGVAQNAGHGADVDVLHLRTYVQAAAGGLCTKALEHEGGLLVDFACAAGFMPGAHGLVLQVGIGNGRADGIRIRVAVADHHNFTLGVGLIHC